MNNPKTLVYVHNVYIYYSLLIERALALATLVNGKMTRTESSYQELLLVVEAHRKMYALKTKKDLKKLL